jgi:hypothetical protein
MQILMHRFRFCFVQICENVTYNTECGGNIKFEWSAANVKKKTAAYSNTGPVSQHLLGETEEYHDIPVSGQWKADKLAKIRNR